MSRAPRRCTGSTAAAGLVTQFSGGSVTLSTHNQHYLTFLKYIYDLSNACATVTYIWGGFTLNLLEVLDRVMALYEQRGYATQFREDIDMLVISRGDLHAAFNRLEIDGAIAMWRHIGNEGTVYFPADWLDDAPQDFYDTRAYSAGIQLDYTLKTNIRMIHATWELREKDRAAVAYLEKAMAVRGMDPEKFLRRAWSFNPFWAKRGYPAYAMPTVARPLHPLNSDEA